MRCTIQLKQKSKICHVGKTADMLGVRGLVTALRPGRTCPLAARALRPGLCGQGGLVRRGTERQGGLVRRGAERPGRSGHGGCFASTELMNGKERKAPKHKNSWGLSLRHPGESRHGLKLPRPFVFAIFADTPICIRNLFGFLLNDAGPPSCQRRPQPFAEKNQ